MSGQHIDPHILRRIAADIIEKTAADTGFPEDEWPDLVTSLVRQWVTYDQHATLFPDESRKFNYKVTTAPSGEYGVEVGKNKSHWSGFLRDWKINADDLSEILFQLNRGQGAEVINGNGKALRIYVDPKGGKTGVDPLEPEVLPADAKPDYEKIANEMVEEQLADEMDIDAKDDLVQSIVQKWRRYKGHACIFMDERRQLTLEFEERAEGPHVVARKWSRDARPYLSSLGFQSWDMPDALARINLGEEVEFEDRQGRRSWLGYDPKLDKFRVRTPAAAPRMAAVPPPVGSPPWATAASSPRMVPFSPIFCPKCNAVLSLWRADQWQQTCAVCGEIVARG